MIGDPLTAVATMLPLLRLVGYPLASVRADKERVGTRDRDWAGRGLAGIALGCVVALAAVGSAPASFRGRNGVIVFSSRTGENVTPQLFSITTAGESRRNLTHNPYVNVHESWSPDGRRIVFARQSYSPHGGTGVVVMDANGLRSRLLAAVDVPANPVWSPDGSLIAYIGDWTIHVMRSDGTDDRTLDSVGSSASKPTWAPEGTRFAATTGGGLLTVFDLRDGTKHNVAYDVNTESSPMWSPDGSTIAYATKSGEIRLIRPDGSGERVVTMGRRVVWSPDGTHLAVTGADEGRGGTGDAVERPLVVLRGDGSGSRTLSHHAADVAPTWSPDGRRVAFVEMRPVLLKGELDPVDTADVFIANADGRNRRRVTHEPGGTELTEAAWSPGGKHIVYSARYDDFNDLDLYAVGPRGGPIRALTRNNVNDYDPAWSPDAKRLAFVRAPKGEQGRSRILVADASARHARPLTPNGSYASPTWSPDGKSIAFARWVPKAGASYVFVMHADGSSPRELVQGYAPSWSPDGRRIAIVDGDSIAVARVDGSHFTRIVSYGRVLRLLNDAPAGIGLFGGPAWSPGGREIVFAAATSDDDARPLYDLTTALAVRPDGSRLRVLYGPVDDLFTVDWSPDGKSFLICGSHILLRPTAGDSTTNLTPGLARGCETATWQSR